jgi:hypothetical protein
VVSGELVCSFAALDVIGEALRLNVRRFPFAIQHYSATREDRIRLAGAVHRDLVVRGLVQGDEFAPELVAALHVFARGPLVIVLVGSAGDTQPVALAAADDRTGVVAVQHGESIEFRLCQPDAVVRNLVGLLPVMRPGPGASVTVTDTSAPARGRPVKEDFSDLTFATKVRAAAPSSGSQRAAAEEILRRPRLGGGYFQVTARGRNGHETELGTINYLDTDVGRYAVIPATGPDGRIVATYTPADQAALGQHLTRILDSGL